MSFWLHETCERVDLRARGMYRAPMSSSIYIMMMTAHDTFTTKQRAKQDRGEEVSPALDGDCDGPAWNSMHEDDTNTNAEKINTGETRIEQ